MHPWTSCQLVPADIVLLRQRPATAPEIAFITLEDDVETADPLVHPGRDALPQRGAVGRAGSMVHVVRRRCDAIDGEAARVAGSPQTSVGPELRVRIAGVRTRRDQRDARDLHAPTGAAHTARTALKH